MKQPEPQAVLTPITEAAIFLVLVVHCGAEGEVRDLLEEVAGLTRSVGFRIPEGCLTCVTGLGSALWDRILGRPRPADLHPFRELVGAKHTAVATPGDLLFHIRAHRLDLCFELAQLLVSRLVGHATVVDEVHGFRFFDERDLLGFVDGTENPAGQAAREATLVGEEDPGFAGGSYVVVQKYRHDLKAWNSLPVSEQERAMGRTKLTNIEMADEVKPANSHVTLNTIVDETGKQQQILRYNMPFGRVGVGEFGTYFIGYARAPAVIEQMLSNMFIGKPPGNTDRILDFSVATTGNLFFVPNSDFLNDLQSPQSETSTIARAAADVNYEESLRIGSLKGSAG